MLLVLTPLERRDCPSGGAVAYPPDARLQAVAAESGGVPAARLSHYDLGPLGGFDYDDLLAGGDRDNVVPPWPYPATIAVSADPATPGADTTGAMLAVAQMPRSERVWLAARGVSVAGVAGPPSSLPQLSYLRGAFGLVGDGGQVFGDEIGYADWATRTAYVRATAAPHFTLHELAHLIEPLLTPAESADYSARVYPALRDGFGAATYFGGNPSESLAEAGARRWEGWPVPGAALDWYDGVFHGVAL